MRPQVADDDAPRLELVHRLRAISVQLDLARAAFARAHALHDTDVRALICLLDAERAGIAATPGWLGAQLGLTSPATTALIDRLAAAGHVRRRPSPTDRRKVELRVSEQAVTLGWDFFGPLLSAMVAAMRQFSPAELETVGRFLREVAAVTHWQEPGDYALGQPGGRPGGLRPARWPAGAAYASPVAGAAAWPVRAAGA
ncbi:MAG: MarR family transcriptional regulator [Actinobacteria bacterium]|nr:MarR family transcriptional regulator [Actinomycetota bacterium]